MYSLAFTPAAMASAARAASATRDAQMLHSPFTIICTPQLLISLLYSSSLSRQSYDPAINSNINTPSHVANMHNPFKVIDETLALDPLLMTLYDVSLPLSDN